MGVGHAEEAATATTALTAATAAAKAAATAAQTTATAALAAAHSAAKSATTTADLRHFDRQHQVGHRIDLGHQLRLGLFGRGDDHHFVANHVGQLLLLEHQPQGRSQRDVLQLNRDRLVAGESRVFERRLVELDRNLIFGLQEVDDVLERLFGEIETRCLERAGECFVDSLFRAAGRLQVHRGKLLATNRELFPERAIGINDRRLSPGRESTAFPPVQRVDKTAPPCLPRNFGEVFIALQLRPILGDGCHHAFWNTSVHRHHTRWLSSLIVQNVGHVDGLVVPMFVYQGVESADELLRALDVARKPLIDQLAFAGRGQSAPRAPRPIRP